MRDAGLRSQIAIPAVLLLLLGSAALEAAGIETTRLLPLPGGLGDPWLVAIPILLLLGVGRLAGSSRSRVEPGRTRMHPADLVPMTLAVLGTGFALNWARPFIEAWTDPDVVSSRLAGPLYRLGMGGVMLFAIAALLLVPRFRRRLRKFASARRLRSGLFFTVSVAAVAYAILLGVAWLAAGKESIQLEVPLLLPAGVALLVGQIVIAVAEEIFYRGILQREVMRLFGKAGMERQRDCRLAAMMAVSALFAMHHVGPGMTSEAFVAIAMYAFAMSMLFGFLFDLTGNLAVCSLAHLFNNMMVLRLGPFVAAGGRTAVFGDVVYIAAFLLVAFAFIFLLARNPSRRLEAIRHS
jgi:membrane protease YdiL (CAAX protease family)